jgi:glycosyltransferase involved in cell wall biosynthesis
MHNEQGVDFRPAAITEQAIDVTIVMPCLNETQSLPYCIGNALDALARLRAEYGMSGEIVVADNGSTDGSQALATELGARVVAIPRRGYGAALIGGCEAAKGRFILMGDCDGSYNFVEGVAMITRLAQGDDICMGSRFKGGIAPGAMPWKNRYIGNPALTGILNLFFRSGIGDAHCGLRAIRKEAFAGLRLTSSGMEFASEMVIKAALQKLKMTEVPATLSLDLRERAPHLRPWRDGWRHLRYLFMLSPTCLFGVPAIVGALFSLLILAAAVTKELVPGIFPAVGNYWVVLGAALLGISHLAGILALACNLYGVRAGYRLPSRWIQRIARFISLETMLVAGAAAITTGIVLLGVVLWSWQERHFAATYSVLPAVIGTLCLTLGFQNALGGFLLAILGGNEAHFLTAAEAPRPTCADVFPAAA